MDILSDIFRMAKIRSTAYYVVDLATPWGLELDHQYRSYFHVVMAGECWIKLAQDEPILLKTGDIVTSPHGDRHWIADYPANKRISIEEFRKGLLRGQQPFSQGAITTTLLCGHYSLDSRFDHPLLAALPQLLIVRSADTDEYRKLKALIELVASEANLQKPGTQTILSSLTEALIYSIHRSYYLGDAIPAGFWDTFKDARIAHAVQLIHDQPEHSWTVQKIASVVGMSRTAFAIQFKRLAGMSPMHYLTFWRMRIACNQMLSTDETVENTGLRLGYGSQEAFIRAFQREIGFTPGQYRKNNTSLS